jgi:hypothetical protein
VDLLAVLVGNSVPLRGARVRAQHNTALEDNADDGGTRFPGTRRVSRLDEVLVAPRVAEVEPRCVKHSEKRVEFGAAGGVRWWRPPRRTLGGRVGNQFCDF